MSYLCVAQTPSEGPVYPQTRPPPVPAVETAQAVPSARAAAEPTQVTQHLRVTQGGTCNQCTG